MFRPENAQSLLGLSLVLLVCWALSEDRSRFPWRLALGALAVQVVLLLLIRLRVPQLARSRCRAALVPLELLTILRVLAALVVRLMRVPLPAWLQVTLPLRVVMVLTLVSL